MSKQEKKAYFKENIEGYPIIQEQQELSNQDLWAGNSKKALQLFALKNSCLRELAKLDRILTQNRVPMYNFTPFFWHKGNT